MDIRPDKLTIQKASEPGLGMQPKYLCQILQNGLDFWAQQQQNENSIYLQAQKRVKEDLEAEKVLNRKLVLVRCSLTRPASAAVFLHSFCWARTDSRIPCSFFAWVSRWRMRNCVRKRRRGKTQSFSINCPTWRKGIPKNQGQFRLSLQTTTARCIPAFANTFFAFFSLMLRSFRKLNEMYSELRQVHKRLESDLLGTKIENRIPVEESNRVPIATARAPSEFGNRRKSKHGTSRSDIHEASRHTFKDRPRSTSISRSLHLPMPGSASGHGNARLTSESRFDFRLDSKQESRAGSKPPRRSRAGRDRSGSTRQGSTSKYTHQTMDPYE